MWIQEMTAEECREELQRVTIGHLGCAKDNQPYVVPITFAYAGRHLYGFSTPGQKIDWMRVNPQICLQVDERTSHDQWMSIVVYGRYEELPDTAEFAAPRAQAQEALQRHASWWEYTAIPTGEWRRKEGPFTPIFYRIHIDSLTGHRATPKRRA